MVKGAITFGKKGLIRLGLLDFHVKISHDDSRQGKQLGLMDGFRNEIFVESCGVGNG